MDITFEDVANVIQDARYQQVLTRNAPQPVTKIKLPKKFDPLEFLVENNVTVDSMLHEPLGRYFLRLFADVSEVPASQQPQTSARNLNPDACYLQRDPEGYLHTVLAFAEDWSYALRSNPNGYVPILDILVLIQKHSLEVFFDEAMQGAKSEESLSFETLKKEFPDQFDDSVRRLTKVSNAQLISELDPPVAPSANENKFQLPPLVPSAQLKGLPALENTKSAYMLQTKSSMGYQAYNSEMSMLHASKKPAVATYSNYSSTNLRYETGPANSVLRARLEKVHASSTKLAQDAFNDLRSEMPDTRTMIVNGGIETKIKQTMEPLFDSLVQDPANASSLKEYTKFKQFAQQEVGEKNLVYHRLLGQGAFGSVYACLIAEVGTVLAMKILNKKKVKLKNAKSQVVAELEALILLAKHPSPYTMHLRYAFESKENYNLTLLLAIGGDLKYHLRHGSRIDGQHVPGIPLARARIYAAEIAFGLGHMHKLGMLMRDLKPRNILLDASGHVKISDFGLVVRLDRVDIHMVTGKAGTEGYWAPQVIKGQYYSFEADWFSYGCCLFELIAGFNPFSTKFTGLESRDEGTLSGHIKYPDEFCEEAKPLIDGLLTEKPSLRLGSRKGVEEVMDQTHPFWEELNLLDIKFGNSVAIWKPDRNKIYAEKQQEIVDYEKEAELNSKIKKLKLSKDDYIPEFKYFMDVEMHQNDIIKVVPSNTTSPRILAQYDPWDDNYVPVEKSRCCVFY